MKPHHKFLTDFKRDIERGIHSNIPECCIEFWIFFYMNFSEKRKEAYGNIMRIINNSDACYILCPECMLKKDNPKLHLCTKKCKGKIGGRKK